MADQSTSPSPAKVDENGPVGVVSVLSFLCELGMLALHVYAGVAARRLDADSRPAGHRGPGGRDRRPGVWMAPTSSTRLRDPARRIAQLVLVAAVGAVAALAGPLWLGVAFAGVASALFALSRSVA